MRYFMLALSGVPTVAPLAALMGHQDLLAVGPNGSHAQGILLRDEKGDQPAMATLGVKKLALSILQMSDATHLGPVILMRLAGNDKLQQAANGWSRFYVVLEASRGAAISAGDETINLHAGEIWWVDGTVLRTVMNNSAEDLTLLQVDVVID